MLANIVLPHQHVTWYHVIITSACNFLETAILSAWIYLFFKSAFVWLAISLDWMDSKSFLYSKLIVHNMSTEPHF